MRVWLFIMSLPYQALQGEMTSSHIPDLSQFYFLPLKNYSLAVRLSLPFSMSLSGNGLRTFLVPFLREALNQKDGVWRQR